MSHDISLQKISHLVWKAVLATASSYQALKSKIIKVEGTTVTMTLYIIKIQKSYLSYFRAYKACFFHAHPCHQC